MDTINSVGYISADDVAELVLLMNGAHGRLTSADYQTLDARLRRISEDYPADARFRLAGELFTNTDSHVQFFAAFLMKTIAGSPKAAALKSSYLDYIGHAIEHNYSLIVVRKLCDATAALYCSSADWDRCFEDFSSRYLTATRADQNAVITGLILADALIQQTGQLEDQSAHGEKINNVFLKRTIPQVLHFLQLILHKKQLADRAESPLNVLVKIFQHPAIAQAHDPTLDANLVQILQTALGLVTTHGWDELKSFSELVDTVLTKCQRIVSKDLWEGLVEFTAIHESGPAMRVSRQQRGQERDANRDPGAREMLLSIAFHSLNMEEIFSYIGDSRWNFILSTLILEYGCEDFDEENYFSLQLLDFWNEFIDSAIFIGAEKSDYTDIISIEKLVLEITFHVIKVSAGADASKTKLGGNLVDEFSQLLKAAYSFFQQSFIQTPYPSNMAVLLPEGKKSNRLLSLIIGNSMEYGGDFTWQACIFTFLSVAEFAVRNATNDKWVFDLLRSASSIGSGASLTSDPAQRSLVADFMGSYALWFQRNDKNLIPALRDLFTILKSSDPQCMETAAGSILSICRDCQGTVVQYASVLLHEFQALRDMLWAYEKVKRLLYEAIAIVTSTADRHLATRAYTQQLVNILEADVGYLLNPSVQTSFIELLRIEEKSVGALRSQYALATLENIREIGLAMSQGSNSISAINLEDDGTGSFTPDHEQQDIALQQTLLRCISQLFSIVELSGIEDALRLVCELNLLSTNYEVPKFYRFPPSTQLEIVRTCMARDLATDFALTASATMLRSKRNAHDEQTAQAAEETLVAVMQYMHKQSTKTGDPDILTSALDLLSAYVTTYPALLDKYIDGFAVLLTILTALIVVPESLPKAAVCQLWTTLLDDGYGLVQRLSEQHLQTLIWNLCAQITGGAMQRDLDILSTLVGKLVVKGPNVRRTFEEAFRVVESQGANVVGWQRFIGQIYMLRGKKRETKDVVQRFWEQCRNGSQNTQTQDDEEDEVVIVLDD